ncbi:MAG TPA: Xaa-Pro peptidase family protein [Tepidisphaeraceae bacterium]|nr:Xaa-Pro peptidase family protein [Tepidisphaeraceae bacterium]
MKVDTTAGLTAEGCRARQARLRELARAMQLDAVLLLDPRHVHYFTGHWGRAVFKPILLVPAESASVLVVPYAVEASPGAEVVLVTDGVRHGTLVDDQLLTAIAALRAHRLGKARAIGYDCQPPPGSFDAMHDVGAGLLAMRRRKDADEIELIRRGIRGCEVAYAAAPAFVRPGVTETDVYAELHRTAVRAVGEPIGEFGNDFQSGTPGGPPRRRAIEAGELVPLDLSVVVRGYSSDLCRTFAVGGEPSAAQREAHCVVVDAIERVERKLKPGTSCRALHAEIAAAIDGHRGWRFPHHLGHGSGLSAHEAPRLNPRWDDILQEGDVFTIEPGLYGDELRGGVRVEQDYLLTADGAVLLSSFPTVMYIDRRGAADTPFGNDASCLHTGAIRSPQTGTLAVGGDGRGAGSCRPSSRRRY